MMSGCVVRAVGAVICALATAIASLFVARFFNGIGKSLFQVSRQSYIAGAVPNHHRGRVNALIGGVSRISNIVAPLIGGAMAEYISSISVINRRDRAEIVRVGVRVYDTSGRYSTRQRRSISSLSRRCSSLDYRAGSDRRRARQRPSQARQRTWRGRRASDLTVGAR